MKVKTKKKLTKRKLKDSIFVALLLAYPVLQFVLVWAFVNIGSLLMAFQNTGASSIYGQTVWTFDNFRMIFQNFFQNKYCSTKTGIPDNWIVILNSLGFAFITIFISLPLALISSYFLSKKMRFANVFRIIFFLPNVIPVVALTLAFNMPFRDYGYLHDFFGIFGIDTIKMYDAWPTSQTMVYLYCIWAGLGYNILLLSGAISRIPKELYESAELDGAGYFTEFTKITIPMIWPTIVTLIVLGMTSVLTLYLQPYLLTAGSGSTGTIAMNIFASTVEYRPAEYGYNAALGLLLSMIWAPIVMIARKLLSKKYSEVDY